MSRARLSGCLAAVFWTAVLTPVSAETLPELFSRAKAKVAAGAYAEALATLNQLEAEVQKPENEVARTPLRPAAAFYRGVCLAALGEPDRAREEFAIFIAANPEKDIDRKAYPASVVAAFQQARKSSPGAEKAEEVLSSLALAYRSTAFPSESSAPPGPDWANGPVKHLLRQEESRAFFRLSDGASRTEFVARFWRARDPRPDTPENEFRREFERRVAFADEKFSEGSKRGSLTERGMVFVMVGPPSGTIRRPLTVEEDASPMLPMIGSRSAPSSRTSIGLTASDQPSNWKEIWTYRRKALPPNVPYQQVDFV